MLTPIDGGSSVEVCGLVCHLPPVPPKKDILFSSHPKDQQYWRRTPLPDFYTERRPDEEAIQEDEEEMVEAGELDKVTHFDPVLQKYRLREWERRLKGVHFMNNGVPTYLTGPHYTYLQWCQFDHKENDGYPIFYMAQLDRFYFRSRCEEDPLSLGYLIIGARAFGKTTEETAMILESLTRPHRRRMAALQSKSEDDAKDVIFKAKFVPCFKSLPHFFKPQFNHGSNPETKLSFYRPAKRGIKAKKVLYGPEYELENIIYFVSAKEKALDGTTMSEIYTDEIGKTDPKREADVYKRHHVNRFCVFRNDRKIGMIRATTTVEEMDKGGDECEKVWKESNQAVRTPIGMTTSGLFRMFVSCLDTTTRYADKFGVIDKEKAKKYHEGEREHRKHDIQQLSSWIRKNPMYEEEAFIKDASKSLFNVFILTERKKELHNMKRLPFITGNFYWKSGKPDTDVAFKEDTHTGRWNVAKLLDLDQKFENQKKLANNVSYYMTADGKTKMWLPKNNRLFRIGTDPIKYSKTKDPRASKAAMHTKELFNPLIDHNKEMLHWTTNNWITEYIHRPEDPAIYYEDFIMQMRYYGCSALIESNIKELIKHLVDRGYAEFIIFKRNFDADEAFIQNVRTDDGGISSVKEVINAYITRLIAFINKHGHRIKFPRTIDQLLDFEAENTTLYDAVVSAGYTELAAEAVIDEELDVQEIQEWFDSYDQYTESNRSEVDESEENTFLEDL